MPSTLGRRRRRSSSASLWSSSGAIFSLASEMSWAAWTMCAAAAVITRSMSAGSPWAVSDCPTARPEPDEGLRHELGEYFCGVKNAVGLVGGDGAVG